MIHVLGMSHAISVLRVVHAMPPAPLTSEARIRCDTETSFKDRMETCCVTPLSVRMKIYHAYCRLLDDECSALR